MVSSIKDAAMGTITSPTTQVASHRTNEHRHWYFSPSRLFKKIKSFRRLERKKGHLFGSG